MNGMPKVPESTKSSLGYKLRAQARERWPQLADVEVTHRAGFAYVSGVTADGEELRLCRLRYGGSASRWGFAIYRASHDDYQPSMVAQRIHRWQPPKTPSTPPAASTSATPPPGSHPRRTNSERRQSRHDAAERRGPSALRKQLAGLEH